MLNIKKKKKILVTIKVITMVTINFLIYFIYLFLTNDEHSVIGIYYNFIIFTIYIIFTIFIYVNYLYVFFNILLISIILIII